MGKCNQCGMCCRAIALRYTKKEIAATWSDINGKFMVKNWVRISKKQALKNNPHVAHLQKLYAEEGSTTYWYACKLLKDGLCSVHENKPPICSGYPWYDQQPDKGEYLYSATCGFKEDIAEFDPKTAKFYIDGKEIEGIKEL